ncbi:MAG: DUF3592 domain-containing protein [Victivallales bacterium]|jgi:hypothetical protein
MKNVFYTKSLAVAVLLAGLVVSGYGISIILDASKCRNWNSVKGRIIHSFAADACGMPENKTEAVLNPYIVYEYAIGGRTYFSDNISFLDFGTLANLGDTYYSGSEDEVRKLLNKYPVDAAVTVYYNPGNIEESVIDTGLKPPVFIVFILGLLLSYISFHIYIYGAFVHLKDAR